MGAAIKFRNQEPTERLRNHASRVSQKLADLLKIANKQLVLSISVNNSCMFCVTAKLFDSEGRAETIANYEDRSAARALDLLEDLVEKLDL